MAGVEIFGLLAETFVHTGRGQSAGAIDLPVMRERTTDYPFIPGSSIKGALRDATKGDASVDSKRLFGEQDNAGALLIGDARLVLLPVRSLSSPYRWVSCPLLLERLDRDLRRAGRAGVAVPDVEEGKTLAAEGSGDLYLEERQFAIGGKPDDALTAALAKLIAHDGAGKRLAKQLVVLHDNDFAWFARYALPVQARNVLDEQKKTSTNLWYEEALPPDTLLSLLIGERAGGDAAGTLAGFLTDRRYLQVGGNETVGQGWFAVQRLAETPT
jgi:CRISPR-associated protein Cmr4